VTITVPEGVIIEIRQTISVINLPEPRSEPIEGFWTTEQAAEYVGVHVETLRKWVRNGTFPRIPLPGGGKDFRFSKAMIDRWSEARAIKA
jgi:excisionase family DNA binding protein